MSIEQKKTTETLTPVELRHARAQAEWARIAFSTWVMPQSSKEWQELKALRAVLGLPDADPFSPAVSTRPEQLPDEILTDEERAAFDEIERQIKDPNGEYQKLKKETDEAEAEAKALLELPETTWEELYAKSRALRTFVSKPNVDEFHVNEVPLAPIVRQRWDVISLTPRYKKLRKQIRDLYDQRIKLYYTIVEKFHALDQKRHKIPTS
jgi:hypothetical protein